MVLENHTTDNEESELDLYIIFGSTGNRNATATERRRSKQRINEILNGGKPLLFQVADARKKGSTDEAIALLEQCLENDIAHENDDRFFGIYWQLGDLLIQRGEVKRGSKLLSDALSMFPECLRENHYIKIAETLLALGRNETNAAAILWQGLQRFMKPEDAEEVMLSGEKGARLVALFRQLETDFFKLHKP